MTSDDKSECAHEFYYYPEAANESGWKCCICKFKPGEPPGFSPNLDRMKLSIKVGGLLMDLHNAELVHVSNGTGGDCLTELVSERCERDGVFDQYSILRFILEAMTESHAKYWKKVSDGVLAGNDPRERCHCGKLANVYTGGKAFCSDHWPTTNGAPF